MAAARAAITFCVCTLDSIYGFLAVTSTPHLSFFFAGLDLTGEDEGRAVVPLFNTVEAYTGKMCRLLFLHWRHPWARQRTTLGFLFLQTSRPVFSKAKKATCGKEKSGSRGSFVLRFLQVGALKKS